MSYEILKDIKNDRFFGESVIKERLTKSLQSFSPSLPPLGVLPYFFLWVFIKWDTLSAIIENNHHSSYLLSDYLRRKCGMIDRLFSTQCL
ncbi:hypothetical protein CLV98_111104 [Dyadobacter jejuensis]|uniref:Uncharacterized protein n=1 Tax=Dyadobacter jejuensis TaxID=1082580 RepID=A0A316AIB2_9BACT|nr:hypothetical protein CLV98_111104 [Dyadobacter jejuensis]